MQINGIHWRRRRGNFWSPDSGSILRSWRNTSERTRFCSGVIPGRIKMKLTSRWSKCWTGSWTDSTTGKMRARFISTVFTMRRFICWPAIFGSKRTTAGWKERERRTIHAYLKFRIMCRRIIKNRSVWTISRRNCICPMHICQNTLKNGLDWVSWNMSTISVCSMRWTICFIPRKRSQGSRWTMDSRRRLRLTKHFGIFIIWRRPHTGAVSEKNRRKRKKKIPDRERQWRKGSNSILPAGSACRTMWRRKIGSCLPWMRTKQSRF